MTDATNTTTGRSDKELTLASRPSACAVKISHSHWEIRDGVELIGRGTTPNSAWWNSAFFTSREREVATTPPAGEPVAAVTAGDVRPGLPSVEEIAEALYKTEEPRGAPWSKIIASEQAWHKSRVQAYRLRAGKVRTRLAELPAPAAPSRHGGDDAIKALIPIVAWTIRHFGQKMTSDELADAILSAPQVEDALRTATAAKAGGV